MGPDPRLDGFQRISFGGIKGKLAICAAGLKGAKISRQVGERRGSQVASSNYEIFNCPTPVAGATVTVDIYVNGVSTLTKSVVTR